MAHYLHGPELCFGRKVPASTTLGRIRRACGVAMEQLGEGYVLEPEGISEGGVVFASWPGKKDRGAYKSVRFHGLRNWPFLQDTSDDTPIELDGSRTHLDFFLKAFYGAPPFTVHELAAVASAIADCFADASVKKMPSADVLRRAYASARRDIPDLCA